ncbi:MAG: DUF4422 domain-containing protein [Pseudomonadota bacterium]|nr:DUF4422 domain-containing protein [Pseudomonadota bacterium]
MKKAPSIKILVGYHKPAVLLKNDILTPIHLGRALTTKASKDGTMSREDYLWMLDNMIGDDTGDNISHLNRELCEFTGLYWAWKNYDKLGNPDYIGFMHYRRIFNFNSDKNNIENYQYIGENFAENLGLTQSVLEKQLDNTDIIHAQTIKHAQTVKEQFSGLSRPPFCLNEQIFENVMTNTVKLYPKMKPVINDYLESREHYWFNCFIMKKEIFFKYMEFMSKILITTLKNTNLENESANGRRVLAYISERLTGMFITYSQHRGRNVNYCPIVYIENTKIIQPLFPAFKQNNIAVFCSTDNNYAPYCGVLIQSIITNGSPENNYDIIILEEKLSDDKKERIKKLQQNHPNVSIRFYNVSHLMNNKSFHLCAHFTIATYYRMFAPSIFQNYSKILYLDIDMIVLADIAALYKTDMTGKLLAAAQDYGVIAKIKSEEYEPLEYFQNIVGVKNPFAEYFQAGILLFNIDEMKKKNIEEKLVKTALENNFYYVDQDVLNKVCYSAITLLDSSWNTITNAGLRKGKMQLLPEKLYNKWLADRSKPKIIHYASITKPWNAPESDLADHWWHYARMTPFYEEILFKNLKNKSANTNNTIELTFVRETANYFKNKIKYWRYRLLSKITFGKKRRKYKQKRKELKARLKQVRAFLRGK